jgi:Rieske Fe-S protein
MHRDAIGHRRRDVIVSAGLGLVATALAACTTYGEKLAPAAPVPAGPATPTANTLAKTSDVPVGSGVIIDDVVLTQPSQGVFNGLSAICTHAGCTVAEVAGGTINCRCHGSRYNLDGSVANGPASRPLAAKAISVQGNSIVLG